MKIILFIVTFLFALKTMSGQIEVDIELLQISNVDEVNDSNFLLFDSFMGPRFTFEMKVRNHTDSVISLNLDNIKIKLMYKYQDSVYLTNIYNTSSKYHYRGSINLDTNEQIFIYFGYDIFYYTDIFKGANYSYYKELIEILPTMKLVFYEGKLEKKIQNINNVILIKDFTGIIIPR